MHDWLRPELREGSSTSVCKSGVRSVGNFTRLSLHPTGILTFTRIHSALNKVDQQYASGASRQSYHLHLVRRHLDWLQQTATPTAKALLQTSPSKQSVSQAGRRIVSEPAVSAITQSKSSPPPPNLLYPLKDNVRHFVSHRLDRRPNWHFGKDHKLAQRPLRLRSKSKGAPDSINRVMAEMQDMNVIFCEVQLFIVGQSKRPQNSRLTMISIHHLVATLSGCSSLL